MAALAQIGSIGNFNPNIEDFATYVSRVELFFVANGIANDKKVPAFLTLGGPSVYSLARYLLSPADPAAATYANLIKALKDHHKPKVILIFERYKFYSRNQKSNETVAEFVAGIKSLAHTCSFGDQLDDMLRDRFVMGLSSSETQHTLLAEADLTFKRAVEIATAREAAHKDVQAMGQSSIFSVSTKPKMRTNNRSFAYSAQSSTASPTKPNAACSGCGKFHWKRDCPYRETVCFSCGNRGHLKRCCRQKGSPVKSSKGSKSFNPRQHKVNRVNQASPAVEATQSPSTCYDYVFFLLVITLNLLLRLYFSMACPSTWRWIQVLRVPSYPNLLMIRLGKGESGRYCSLLMFV